MADLKMRIRKIYEKEPEAWRTLSFWFFGAVIAGILLPIYALITFATSTFFHPPSFVEILGDGSLFLAGATLLLGVGFTPPHRRGSLGFTALVFLGVPAAMAGVFLWTNATVRSFAYVNDLRALDEKFLPKSERHFIPPPAA